MYAAAVIYIVCDLTMLIDWQKVEERHGEKRPLNVSQLRVIDYNRTPLVKHLLIDPTRGIVDRLYRNKCMTIQHKDYIECGQSVCDKIERLLDVVRRRSAADFNQFVNALDIGGQPTLAQILRKGGGKNNRYINYQFCNILLELFSHSVTFHHRHLFVKKPKMQQCKLKTWTLNKTHQAQTSSYGEGL